MSLLTVGLAHKVPQVSPKAFTSMSQDPSEIYARLLLVKRQGFPLWMPDPSHRLPLDYRHKGVGVGDVGIITSDGAFDFLFNVCLPPDHVINVNGVPDAFTHLELGPHDVLHFPGHHNPGTDITSMSIKKHVISAEGSAQNPALPIGLGGEFKFVCATSKGAILVLPEGASREDLANRAPFRTYALQHAVNWYRFVNGPLGREARNGSLYLVTGSDRASSWGVASFSEVEREQELSLRLVGMGAVEGDVGVSYSWMDFSPAAVRAGPPPGRLINGVGSGTENQSVFIRGYKITLRDTLWSRHFSGHLTKLPTIVKSKPKDIVWQSDSAPPFSGGTHSTSPIGRSQGSGSEAWRRSEGSPPSGLASEFDGVDLDYVPAEQPLQLYHPSDIINQFKLESSSEDTEAVVTHDDEWCEILRESEVVMPSDQDIWSRWTLNNLSPQLSDQALVSDSPGFVGSDGDHPEPSLGSLLSAANRLQFEDHSPSFPRITPASPQATFNHWRGLRRPSIPVTSHEILSPYFLGPLNSLSSFVTSTASPGFDVSTSDGSLNDTATSSSHSSSSTGLNSPNYAPSRSDTPILLYKDSSTKPLYSHRQRLPFFEEAAAAPAPMDAGPMIPQQMYNPPTKSNQRHFVEELEFEAPIYFWMEDPQECGILLTNAIHARTKRMQDEDEPVLQGRGPSVSIRLEWPGYRPWSRQIPTGDFRSPPGPITKAKSAKSIAKCVQRFIIERKNYPLEDDADERWKVGTAENDIKFEDLILVSLHHVSIGSWQPHLRLRRPIT